MNSSEIDARLQEYTAAEHRIGANLHELEDHAVYQLLTSGVLQGRTAKALEPVGNADPTLWELFSTLNTTLDRARAIRGTKGWVGGTDLRDLVELLTTPSVVLREYSVPLAERGLTGDADREERTTVAGLIERMRSIYEPLRDTISHADRVLTGLLPRLSSADRTLAALRTDVDELGLDRTQLDSITETIERIRDLSLTDPLSIPTDVHESVTGALHDGAASVAGARASHDAIAHDLTEAADVLDRCRSLIATATSDRERALRKVVVAETLPTPPNLNAVDGPRGLAAALKPISRATGPWQKTRRELDSWLSRAERLERQLASVAARIREPLDRRDELRGRLRAFRAKMSGVGLGEDSTLSELSDEVHNELFTAPADLDRAERLLHDFSARLTS